jgi:tetratricopeptide (TPR) repeat protein
MSLPAWCDTITTKQTTLEGRILENSAKVFVVETVAGEYVVIEKNRIVDFTDEPEADFYYRRGQFHLSKGDENRALLDFLEAVNWDSTHAKAREVIEAIQQKQKETKVNQGLLKAQQLIAAQEYRKALDAFQRILELQPDDQLAQEIVKQMSDTYTRIAFLYYDHCYDEGALFELARAEELNPNSAEIYYVLAKIHDNSRKYDLARQEYERALQLNPTHSMARSKLMELIERTRGRRF